MKSEVRPLAGCSRVSGVHADLRRVVELNLHALVCGSLRSREGQVEVGVVHSLQAPDQPLHARRQGLEREVHVREQGVAARRGHVDGMERRTERRRLPKGHVDVPAATEGFDLVGQLDDFDELRIPAHPVRVGVRFELAEAASECQVLLAGLRS